MKFEDLFKAKQPENYVEYPPKKAPTLDSFFADRSNLPVKKSQVPISKPQVDRIKAEYGTAQTEQAPVQEQPENMPASSYMQEPIPADIESSLNEEDSTSNMPIQPQARNLASGYGKEDMKRIREMANELSPKMGAMDYIASLSPLLVEALAGGGETGGVTAGIAGENILKGIEGNEKRRQTIEDKLLELDKTRMLRRNGGGLQTKSVRNKKTQEVEIANFDPGTGYLFSPSGDVLDPEDYEYTSGLSPAEYNRRAEKTTAEIKARGDYFGRGTTIDPTTGLKAQVRNGKIVAIQKVEGLNPKQEKDLTLITDKFRSSDLFKKSEAALIDASNVSDLLQAANSGNASAANNARSKLARMAGEVGALSDSDIERSGGSPSLRRSAQRFANLQASGVPLTATDVKEMMEIAKIYERNARQNIMGAIPGLEKDFIQRGGIKGSVATSMSAYLPQVKESKANKVTRYDKNGKMWTYTLNPKTGKYE
jgi:hypothetical protein